MKQQEKGTYRPSPDALLDPCYDEVFKALFTHNSKESKNALIDFLSILLERKILDISFIPTEPPVDNDNDKQTRFDISCRFDDGRYADIEMQGKNDNNAYQKRAEYLCARLLNYAVPRSLDWQKIPQVFQISLVGFNVDAKSKEPVSWYEMRKEAGQTLSETMNIIFIELPKIRKMLREQGPIPPENLPKLIKWCIFLSEAGNPEMQAYIKELIKTEDGIMQAHTVLNQISTSDILWKKELDEEVVERDRRSFIHAWEDKAKEAEDKAKEAEDKANKAQDKAKEAEDKAKEAELRLRQTEDKLKEAQKQAQKQAQSKALEIAKNMKANGVPNDVIVQCTGLSESEVRICSI